MTSTGKNPVHPVPLLFFLSVVALIAAYRIHEAAGAFLFLASTVAMAAAIGWIIGRRWKMYPWQIGVLGAIAAVLYVLWRLYTQETAQETRDNLFLFIFHPLLVIISGHFGGLVGRWQALKSRPKPDAKE